MHMFTAALALSALIAHADARNYMQVQYTSLTITPSLFVILLADPSVLGPFSYTCKYHRCITLDLYVENMLRLIIEG